MAHIHVTIWGRLSNNFLVFLRRHRWQRLQERHHTPDRRVVMVGPPGRHRTHFDAVLDDPERHIRFNRLRRKVGWNWIKPGANF